MTNRITADNIKEYINIGENDTIEFKRTIHNRFDIIDRVISAFANSKGGSIVFGIDERKGEIVGIVPKDLQLLIKKYTRSEFKKLCTVYTLTIDGKNIAVIDVIKSNTDLYVNGVAYTRNGDRIFGKEGKIRSKFLKDFIDEIQYRNRNPKDTKALELLDDLTTNPERILFESTLLYRCRIIEDMAKVGKEHGYYGYGKKDSFVPPANVTRDLRANYRYIPYLYSASHPYTALVEVRPRLGANVSIATIKVNQKLTLLDFSLNKIPPKMVESKLNLFADLSMLFSKPITSDDDILDYIPTQYIAEYAKQLGYDGIAFRSSLTPELKEQDINKHQDLDRYNVVIFNYNKCEPISSNVVSVTRNYLECEQINFDKKRINIHASTFNTHY